MRIEIDFTKSAQENIEEYFEDSKHARQKLVSSEKAVAVTEQKIKEEVKIVKPVHIKKKELPARWFEKLHWTFSGEGFLIVGGKDATQNEIIYKKYIEPQDIVLHADVAGAPLTVIKTDGKEVPLETLKEAAQFAGVYSSAWKRGVGTIEVYWIKPEQVSKKAQAGEFLSKGSFIISGKRNYLRAVMRIAIGVKNGKVFSGTEESVKKLCGYAVVVTPGSTSKAELAKQIKLRLLKKTNDESILHIDFYEFQRVIPAGKGDMA